MRKILFALALSFTCTVALATGNCPEAAATNSSSFCPTFETSARCHCQEHGLPSAACQDVHKVYSRMLAIYQTVQRACSAQHDTDTQTCIDDWTCYITGGVDSQGRSCSGTGARC